MNKTLVSAQYTRTVHDNFFHVFDLGVKTIEREFDIMIIYDVHFTDNEAKLNLQHTGSYTQDNGWADTVEYKLSTLFTICLDHF